MLISERRSRQARGGRRLEKWNPWMVWLIFALGAVLAVGGALSIAFGTPYVQVEWGWTEVIAGTTALSAGIVTFALGAILFRLGALHRAVERTGLGLRFAEAADEPEVAVRTGSDREDTAAMLDPATLGLKPISAAAEGAVRPPLRLGRTEATAGTEALEASPSPVFPMGSDEGTEAPEAPAPRKAGAPWMQKIRSRLARPADQAATARAGPSAPDLGFSPRLEDSAGGAEDRPGFTPSLDLTSRASEASDDSTDGRESPPYEPAEADRADERPRFEPAEAEEEAPFHRVGIDDVAAAPTVVGRYAAGGASYVLLSDGAIEVETEAGLHRFASMQELRAFIESRDEQAAARQG